MGMGESEGGMGGIDDLVMNDIARFEGSQSFERPQLQGSASPGRWSPSRRGPQQQPSPSYSVSREVTRTRTRFRFTPTEDDREGFYDADVVKASTRLSTELMAGHTELRAPSPKQKDPSDASKHAEHLDTQSKLLEITSHMDTTMHILHEKLGADGLSGGGGAELDLQLDYQMSEGFPASINAVREKLEANLTCFNLMYEAKFASEDAAAKKKEKEEMERAEKQKQELAAEWRLQHLDQGLSMGITAEMLADLGGAQGITAEMLAQPDGAALPSAGDPSVQMMAVMESVAERVRLIEQLQHGEHDGEIGDVDGVPLFTGLADGGRAGAGAGAGSGNDGSNNSGGAAALRASGGALSTGPTLVRSSGRGGDEGLQAGPYGAATLDLTSRGIVTDLDVVMQCMQKRLGIDLDEPDFVKSESEIKEDNKKELLKEFEEKIDLEDERAAARDQLDMKSLGGDSDDELEENKRGAAMDLPQPPLMEWDLLKTQSLDFSELLAQRGREPRYLRTSGNGLYRAPYAHSAPLEQYVAPAPSAPPLPDMLPSEHVERTYPSYEAGPSSPPRRLDRGLQFETSLPMRDHTILHPSGRLDEGLDEHLDVSKISDARERLERFRRMREAVDDLKPRPPEADSLRDDPAGRLQDFRNIRLQRQEMAGLVA